LFIDQIFTARRYASAVYAVIVSVGVLGATENARLELSAPHYRGGKCGTKQLWKAKIFYTFWYKIRKSLLTQFEILW